MKKRIVIASLSIAAFFVLAWGMGGRTGFDYGLTCTRCLDDSHVIERKFLGVTYRTIRTPGSKPSDYFEITGHECKHVYHKGGCGQSKVSWLGRSIGCGMTGEGLVFRDRNRAVRRTFELHRKFGSAELSRRTLDLTDRLLPPDFDWKASRGLSEGRDRLLCFAWAFEQADSEESWKKLLDLAEHGTLEELSNAVTPQVAPSNGDRPSN